MRPSPIALLPLLFAFSTAFGQTRSIDLRTTEGVKSVQGTWRYHDVKIIDVEAKGPDGKPVRSYGVEPRAGVAGFDDSQWEIVAPETLKDRRAPGKVCFCWYRIKITLPEGVTGKTVEFFTTVDDYGEIWVNGQLPRRVGQKGGNIVAGFNVPNQVELKDPTPGKVYEIAIFGINGPISAEPENYIFLGPTYLEIREP